METLSVRGRNDLKWTKKPTLPLVGLPQIVDLFPYPKLSPWDATPVQSIIFFKIWTRLSWSKRLQGRCTWAVATGFRLLHSRSLLVLFSLELSERSAFFFSLRHWLRGRQMVHARKGGSKRPMRSLDPIDQWATSYQRRNIHQGHGPSGWPRRTVERKKGKEKKGSACAVANTQS